MRFTRRGFLSGGLGLAVLPGGVASSEQRSGAATMALARTALRDREGRPDPLAPLWEAWKAIHVSSSGRVIDRPQDNISHSEGQGYAMLIAEALGDREGFERLLAWTRANLAVRDGDALLAWRWHPGEGGRVTDMNNASDGDLFVAWALVRAADRFEEPAFLDAARDIAADLVRLCLRPCPGRGECELLLPGATGFEDDAGVVINPAYYMPRALAELGAATGETALIRCAADGNALLSQLARRHLVPDWVHVSSDGFAPVEGKSHDFGYEAMRVPLYLVWSGLPGHPAVARAGAAYAAALAEPETPTPTLLARESGEVLETSTDPGYRALAALVACAERRGTARLMPAFAAGQPYYPGVLHLLSLLAQRESSLGCYLR